MKAVVFTLWVFTTKVVACQIFALQFITWKLQLWNSKETVLWLRVTTHEEQKERAAASGRLSTTALRVFLLSLNHFVLHSEYQKHFWPPQSWQNTVVVWSCMTEVQRWLLATFSSLPVYALSVYLRPVHWFWPTHSSSVLEGRMLLWHLRAGPCSVSSLCNLNRPQQAKESTSHAHLKRSDITSLLIWPNTSSLVLDFSNIYWLFIYHLFRRKRNQKLLSC